MIAVRRVVEPVWLGASPLVLLITGLLLGGFLFQLAESWASAVGDSAWTAAFLLFALGAATEPRRPVTNIGRGSAASFVLVGLYAAAVMVYWVLVDSGRVARSGNLYLVPAVVLAAVGVLSRIAANRTTRTHPPASG